MESETESMYCTVVCDLLVWKDIEQSANTKSNNGSPG